MPLQIQDTKTNSVLFSNDYVAEDFSADILKEDSVVLDMPFGKADMKQWYFTGIRMAYSQWQYYQPNETEWVGMLDVVTMIFNIQGKCCIQPKEMDRPLELMNQQMNIFYATGGNATLKNDDLSSSLFIVQFTKAAFLRLTGNTDTSLSGFSEKVASGKEAYLYPASEPIDLATGLIIDSIISCGYSGDLKKMFLLSKTIELLVLQAKCLDMVLGKKNTFIKTDYDKQRITFVKEVLMKNMQSPPGLSRLATMAGINEFKLKKGFKEMFGYSVFGYLAELRLSTAMQALVRKSKTINELADDLGYSSTQHFSTAFKSRFGISPGKVKSGN
jgi:AraC family transcriptional regulator, transcriptional activator of the genes for pyochelin and ferripyochelin receptors